MATEELKDKILLAIGKPENQYPTVYARTSDGKDHLHIWMTSSTRAADSVIELLKELKLIP
jgi:hypothetical protein